jgi:hypothetical protein
MSVAAAGVSAAVVLATSVVSPPDHYAYGLLFLRAAYPELNGRKLGVGLGSPYPRNYDVPIHRLRSFALILEEGPMPNGPTHETEAAPFLRANFEFDSRDRLESFVAFETPFTRARERHDAEAMMRAHREWSPTQAGIALKDMGARFYPPDDTSIRGQVELVLQRLTPLLGSGRVSGTEWLQLDELVWRTQVRYRDDRSVYQMLWEPFDGKLVALRRHAE